MTLEEVLYLDSFTFLQSLFLMIDNFASFDWKRGRTLYFSPVAGGLIEKGRVSNVKGCRCGCGFMTNGVNRLFLWAWEKMRNG
jgi:hypothetical protein